MPCRYSMVAARRKIACLFPFCRISCPYNSIIGARRRRAPITTNDKPGIAKPLRTHRVHPSDLRTHRVRPSDMISPCLYNGGTSSCSSESLLPSGTSPPLGIGKPVCRGGFDARPADAQSASLRSSPLWTHRVRPSDMISPCLYNGGTSSCSSENLLPPRTSPPWG
jgi:hypothetical protein